MKTKAHFKNITLLITVYFLFLCAIYYLLIPFTSTQPLLLLGLYFIISTILLSIILKTRYNEIEEIKNVIKKIRLDQYSDPNQIVLSENLRTIEDEIKEMFNRTQSDIQNLKKLEQIRTEFLGNVSHELRTPIFSIQGYLETLLDGALEDPKVNRSFLKKANNHTLNLNNLLNELIDISMIESGQMKMSFRFFNIHEFLKSLESEFRIEAENKNLVFSIHSPNPKLDLFGDKSRLKQVMVNLLTNAIKYSENGSVEIGVIEEGSFGKVYVKDTGLGIPEADLSRIFERFYRVDRDRSREMGGTGLGLAIVKHIIEAHQSKIEVKSKIGLGSEFVFKLKK